MRFSFKMLTVLFIMSFVLLGYFGGWWDTLWAELWTRPGASIVAPKPDPPAIVISQPQLTGWDDLKKTWQIEAERIWQSSKGNTFHFTKILNGVVFSAKDERIEFSAGWGRLEKSSSDLYIGGELEAIIGEGRFKTAEAFMNYKREELLCPNDVIYIENEMVIQAQKMEIQYSKDEILLEGDVQLFEKRDLMTADGLLYNTKEKKYYMIHPKEITLYP